jgi:ATP-citrate lyase beta-subunit
MAQRGIREYDAKRLMEKYVEGMKNRVVLVDADTKLSTLPRQYAWLKDEKLVVKPDQLFGKRGKNNLLLLNKSWEEAEEFINKNMGKEVTVGRSTGKLTHFLIEPFVPHKTEYYLAIRADRDGDTIYFSSEGGIDIEENWDKVTALHVPIDKSIDEVDLVKELNLKAKPGTAIADFIKKLFKFYVDLQFTYLELNPFAVEEDKVMALDTVAKVDDTAVYECASKWGELEFPTPFGLSELSKEEQFIKDLDAKTGASLKLTILNPEGRVWTMVAGGGASVIYADTICDLNFMKELANYGEYSGDPSEEFTYLYAKTILELMTKKKNKEGKILIIGGGIANFTDVAKTFTGIIRALRENAEKLRSQSVKIYVRRAGPNYQAGLEMMKKLSEEIKVPIAVHGPETHMTRVVSMALLGEKTAEVAGESK